MTFLCRISVAVFLLASSLVAAAQETPTEREAARGVLQKMADLERSLDIPALVQRLTGPNPQRDQVVSRARQLMDTELLAMSDDITRHPEIGFVEKRSVQILTDYLRKHDFDVQPGVAGLDTAFVAKWKGSKGAPILAVILEYDALRARVFDLCVMRCLQVGGRVRGTVEHGLVGQVLRVEIGEVRRQHCNRTLPVAVLSNLDREEPTLDRARELGVIGCLLKSQTVPRTLAGHIRSWLPHPP